MDLVNLREKIHEGISVNIINTKKFKTNLISVYFLRPLIRDEVTKNALLPLVLKRGTENFKTSLEIQRKLEDLYGANLSIDVSKKGERHAIRFTIESPQDSYIKGDNIKKQIFNMLNDIIHSPVLEKGFFLGKYVNQEKENLKKRIEGRINDKQQYAVDRCIEEMCKNERFSNYKYGYTEDLEAINEESLYNHYKKVLETSPIEISLVGDFEKEGTISLINETFTFERKDIINIPREDILKEVTTKNMVSDRLDVNQGKLCLGFRTNIPFEDKLYNGLMVANEIFGGGPNSKLFLNVREKESLAYYVYSKSYKYKSIMIVACGLEFDKFDKGLEIIKKQVEEMKLGNFTEDDIEVAKNSIVTSIRSMTDSSFSISEFYLSQALTNDKRNINELIEDIRKVTKEDIVKASNKLSLDTIYLLKNKEIEN